MPQGIFEVGVSAGDVQMWWKSINILAANYQMWERYGSDPQLDALKFSNKQMPALRMRTHNRDLRPDRESDVQRIRATNQDRSGTENLVLAKSVDFQFGMRIIRNDYPQARRCNCRRTVLSLIRVLGQQPQRMMLVITMVIRL